MGSPLRDPQEAVMKAAASSVSLEERKALCQAVVTLNGEPAKVNGYANRFAAVTVKANGLSAQWSWEAVQRVVANGGAFKS